MKTIGLISDTHGLMRPEALEALAGSDLIVHAGDVGSLDVIAALERLAPVHAVRGNTDRSGGCERFPATEIVEVDGTSLYLLHDVSELDLDPAAAGFAAVIYGHSHRPEVSCRRGVLYVNPGAAGPRRFRLPIAVARLQIDHGQPRAEIIELDCGA